MYVCMYVCIAVCVCLLCVYIIYMYIYINVYICFEIYQFFFMLYDKIRLDVTRTTSSKLIFFQRHKKN